MTREERQAEARKRVSDSIDALRTTDGWQRWLKARRYFRKYSLNNQLLIAAQAPDATRVMGFRAWLAFGRAVQAGEKAIKIYGPPKDVDKTDDTGAVQLDAAGKPRRIRYYPIVNVFDFAQTAECETTKAPLPLHPPGGQVIGDPLAAVIATDRLEKYLRDELGYSVAREVIPQAEGYHNRSRRHIAIADHLSPLPALRVLVHEAAHAHDLSFDDYPRATCEVIVDCITYVVLDALGIRSDDSIPYLAGWSAEATELVKEYATLIDSVARKLEDVLVPADVAQPVAETEMALA